MDERPLLAVVYSGRSRPWREIVDAGSALCRVVWVVDSGDAGIRDRIRVLRKLGTVVDTAGHADQEIVQLVHAQHPDGIVCYYDTDLHRQAWLAEALDLPTIPVGIVAKLTDKLLQRQALAVAGVPQPRFAEIREPVDAAELARLCDLLEFPMLLKPRDGTACQGIVEVADPVQLSEALRLEPRPARLILEERMPDLTSHLAPYADRVNVESIVSNGVHSHFGVTGFFPMIPPLRSSGGFFPADLPQGEVAALLAMASAAIDAFGADFGCFRTEIKMTPAGPRIIEVNGRPTGLAPSVVQLAAGVPVLELSMRLALGEHVTFPSALPTSRVAYRFYREPPMSATRVLAISGIEALNALPGVVAVDLQKSVGDPVDWRNGSLDKIFQVTGAVADYAELAEHHRACSDGVVIEYEHDVASRQSRPSGRSARTG